MLIWTLGCFQRNLWNTRWDLISFDLRFFSTWIDRLVVVEIVIPKVRYMVNVWMNDGWVLSM